MEQLLGGAPERFTAAEVGNTSVVEIPLPDGTMSRFLVAESPVMAPDLQGRYVETRCYTGKGLDDPSALLKCDLTPWGFHAMVLRGSGSPVFIDPYQMGDRNSYVVYYKSDYLPKKEDTRFSCETVDDGMQPIKNLETAELQGDCRLRRYRLALACTGEYAAFHGGTKPLVLAALNTSMNRVNGVYEKDFAVTMQLVAKNDTLIFLTPSTDPYTNGNGGTMLGQNVTTCNARIGASNYDIGHVFSTGGGGIAGLGVVCSSSKAQGVTGGGAPVGDPFDIDYVAHEMGHQFGADHTQNNNCNRVVVASMEPGSASTIMGYAGICNPNVQSNSDDYFHAISLQQVGAFTLGSGNTCAVKINTGNTSPVVSAGLDYTIPKSTYFVLSATGSDLENDAMTYCWEQMDPEFATMPPVSTNASGPLFRSFKGTASPLRYFPRLTDILTNANPTWEKLPSVARQMKFRVTVRDNSSLGGCTEEDDMVVTVASNSGPFVVTEPNTSVTWFVGDTRSIKWSVAGTTQAPVSCTQVRITLSLDGGFTYPVVLANSVPNTGTAMITVPNQLSTTCRVRVQGANNVFFDVSDQNFIIQQPPSPTFLLTASPEAVPICVGAGDAVFEVSLAAIAGFNTPVTISVTGAPLGAVVTVTPNQVLPNGSATVVVSGLTGDMAGTYALSIQGSGGSVTQQVPVELVVRPGPPIVSPLVVAPIDSAVGVSPIITLQWVADPIAASYEVELASNPNFGFGSILGTYISTSNSLSVNLNPATVYYWRIRGINTCGMGTFRGYSAFQTADLACNQEFVSTDVPKVIDPNTVNTATTTLGVSSNRVIADVNVKVVANHSYVGDLVGTLVTPVGQNIVLFDRPGVPADQYGCANDNLNLEFDDEAMQSAAQLEVACLSTGTALLGAYQPVQSLSALEGQLAAGTWSLKLEDTYADDGGAITSWSIDFCFTSSNNAGLVLQNLPLVVGSGTSSGITSANLEVQASGSSGLVRYVITRLPAHGSLVLAGVPLVVGSTFTQEQLGLNLLGYTNSGDGSLTDSFGFDVEDLSNKSWIHNQTFLIEVVQNNLQVIVDVIQPVPCYNGIGGTLQAVATGLDGNYEFSLNGGTFQSDGLFTNLSPGTYVVVVRGQFGFSSVSLPVVLANPNPVTVNAILDFNTVTAMASGGTAPYTYSLGGNFAADSVFVAVPNGVYQLIVQDANGCTAVREIIVAVNTMIVSLQVNSAVLCNGGADGEILVNVGGGTAPFLFSLNGGPFVGSGLFSGLSAGTYVVVVRDSAGFESTTNPVLVVEPSELSVAVVSDLNTVTAVASGGTVGYSYSLGGVDFQTTGYFDGLMSGIYMVVAVDGNGCRDTVSVEVVVPPLVLSLVSSGQVSCAGGQDGSLQVAATGVIFIA
jgi:subtilisin-like proprotein convertase family protein